MRREKRVALNRAPLQVEPLGNEFVVYACQRNDADRDVSATNRKTLTLPSRKHSNPLI